MTAHTHGEGPWDDRISLPAPSVWDRALAVGLLFLLLAVVFVSVGGIRMVKHGYEPQASAELLCREATGETEWSRCVREAARLPAADVGTPYFAVGTAAGAVGLLVLVRGRRKARTDGAGPANR